MRCIYLNKDVELKPAKYEKYNEWNNNILQYCANNNLENNWLEIDIQLSKQFNKYFSHENIQNYLKTMEKYYLIGVVYLEPPNKYDVLPCFTETIKNNESVIQCQKRFVKEELFSNSHVLYLANNKWKKQKIHTFHQNIKNISIIDDQMEQNENSDNWRRKMNLLVVVEKREDAENFITEWRARRHNLHTESERLHMVDIVLIKIIDLL